MNVLILVLGKQYGEPGIFHCLQQVILFACTLDTSLSMPSRTLGTGQALMGAATLQLGGLAPFLLSPLQGAHYNNFIPFLVHKCRRDPKCRSYGLIPSLMPWVNAS